jgi:hypothetical protein
MNINMNIIEDYFHNDDHIENIKYIKFDNYVITIDLYKEYLHKAIIFKVLSIKNIINEKNIDKIIKTDEDYIWLFEENKMCHLDCLTKYKFYYDTYGEAFYEDFFENKQYLLMENGHSGLYQQYFYAPDKNNENIYTRDLYIQFYHINGNKEGEFIKYQYHNFKEKQILQYYVNNKKHGLGIYMNIHLDCYMFFSNKYFNIWFNHNDKNYTKLNYNMDKLHGEQHNYLDDKIYKTYYFYNDYCIPKIIYIIIKYIGWI